VTDENTSSMIHASASMPVGTRTTNGFGTLMGRRPFDRVALR